MKTNQEDSSDSNAGSDLNKMGFASDSLESIRSDSLGNIYVSSANSDLDETGNTPDVIGKTPGGAGNTPGNADVDKAFESVKYYKGIGLELGEQRKYLEYINNSKTYKKRVALMF